MKRNTPPPIVKLPAAAAALLFLLGAASLASAAPHGSISSAGLKAEFQKIYSAEDAATERKDATALFKDDAPNSVDIDVHGHTTNLEKSKQDFADVMQYAQDIHSRSVILSVSRTGNTVTIIATQHVELILKNPKTGQQLPAVFDNKSRDTWIKTSEGWRSTVSREIRESGTIDGKPVDPDAPSGPPPNAA